MIIGLEKYPKDNYVNVRRIAGYPFECASFIPKDFLVTSEVNENFRRILGILFGKENAKARVEGWKNDNTSSEEIAKQLFRENIVLGNHEEINTKKFKDFTKNHGKEYVLLGLGTANHDDYSFYQKNFKEVLLYPHPSNQGGHIWFWREFDYKVSGKERWSTPEHIIKNFR